MKVFLRTLLAFVIAPLMWCTIMTVVNRRTQVSEPLPVHARTLAIGDSRIGSGIDPRILKGSENIALPAEPYLLSWCKLRHITAQHRIDTLMLGFAPHILSDKDHRKFRDNGWATERLIKRLYPLVTVPEALGMRLDHQTYARMLFMRYCAIPHDSHLTWVGHFSGLGSTYRADSTEAFDRHFAEKDGTLAPISDEGILWLDSILALAHRQHIELYLVGVPVHASYLRHIPNEYRKRYAELSAHYAAQEGVHVVDRMDHFAGDSLFANCDHLNGKGARRFTRELRAIMRPAPDSTILH